MACDVSSIDKQFKHSSGSILFLSSAFLGHLTSYRDHRRILKKLRYFQTITVLLMIAPHKQTEAHGTSTTHINI